MLFCYFQVCVFSANFIPLSVVLFQLIFTFCNSTIHNFFALLHFFVVNSAFFYSLQFVFCKFQTFFVIYSTPLPISAYSAQFCAIQLFLHISDFFLLLKAFVFLVSAVTFRCSNLTPINSLMKKTFQPVSAFSAVFSRNLSALLTLHFHRK